ncbi:glycerol-3-phosphate dehydrogenase C-terminal domain-containing protein, partial [Brevundimonas sp.]|uniref:glycerol-3-phosphate dehydrogenase C-terminal domain-containing protein n=1 Tax=Brevundimonas sp. TaxID=1871086 RepID=UPI002FC9BA1A
MIHLTLMLAGLVAAAQQTPLPAADPAPVDSAPTVDRSALAAVQAPERLVRRFGSEAPAVLASAAETTGLAEDELVAPGPRGVTLAELVFAVTHEGAIDVEDLLDR